MVFPILNQPQIDDGFFFGSWEGLDTEWSETASNS